MSRWSRPAPPPLDDDSPVTSSVPGEPWSIGDPAQHWITMSASEVDDGTERPLTGRRIVVQLVVGILAVLVVVTAGGAFASQRLAEREAVNDAANTADTLAEAVVQPSLSDALVAGEPAAVAAFDAMVTERIMSDRVVRLKIWSPTGTVIYADETELIGQNFPLDPEEQEVADDGGPHQQHHGDTGRNDIQNEQNG